jgi:hypothetical protein
MSRAARMKISAPAPVREKVPDLAQPRPGLRGEPPGAGEVQRHPRRHHRDHARGADKLFGPDEGEIGQRDRDRDLRALVALEQRHQPDREAADEPAHHRAAQHHQREAREGVGRIRIGDADHHEAEEHAEKRDGGGIVQEAFALDDPGEPARRRDRPEDAHHRRGVGGRDDRADEEADGERQGAGPGQRIADRQRRHEDRHDREHEDRHPVVDHPAQVHPQRRLEQQGRQEDVEEDVGPDRQADNGFRHRVERVGIACSQEEGGPRRDQDAEGGDDDGEGQPEPGGKRLCRADHEEKEGDNGG